MKLNPSSCCLWFGSGVWLFSLHYSRCLPGCLFLVLHQTENMTVNMPPLAIYMFFYLLFPLVISFWPHPFLFLPFSLIPFFTFCPLVHIPSHLWESVLFISSECRGSLVHASHRNQFQLRQHNQTKRCNHFSMGINVTHLSHFLPPAPSLKDILFSLWCHFVNHCRHVMMCECFC